MSNFFRPKEYLKPTNVEEAVKLLAKYGDKAAPIAGGTDVLARRNPRIEALIDISGLGLNYISSGDLGLKIGATTILTDIVESATLNKTPYRILCHAAAKVGTPLIRNLGTIGGNLCNAGPSADTPTALLALDARVKLVSVDKSRWLPLDDFFAGPFRTNKASDELMVEIFLPALASLTGTSYQYLGKITSVDETLVGVAVFLAIDENNKTIKDTRIALSSVAPTPMRAKKAEEALRGKVVTKELAEEVAEIVTGETRPRSRPDYRRSMSAVLVKNTILEAMTNASAATVQF